MTKNHVIDLALVRGQAKSLAMAKPTNMEMGMARRMERERLNAELRIAEAEVAKLEELIKKTLCAEYQLARDRLFVRLRGLEQQLEWIVETGPGV